jgi:acetylornithine/N-succinyldiaminopimelate aminotransferase
MIPAIMPSYGKPELAFERGEGLYLYTTDGRRFLDFGAGIAVTAAGHSHPHLIEALVSQAGKLWHTSNLYRIPQQERLAERLVANSFADTMFFCNSGAEAVEASLKLARKYHHDAGREGRYRVIAFEGSFHGRTLSTISAGANPLHKKGFEPMVEGFDHVPFGNLNALRDAIGAETAAILVEPVQGEGGINPASAEFLRGLREACDEFGLLLIYDEVQCGMGRTGKLFAHEHSGVAPDVMALAKGLGGGFPVGACLATESAAAGIVAGTHGSTFGGNPLAMAVANAVLDIVLEDGFLDRVQAIGDELGRKLNDVARRHPTVIETVRGTGLMWGVKCVVPNVELAARLTEGGLLTVLAADNVVRMLPALVAEQSHIDEACEILEKSCVELEA